jgi:hypothetical protein
MQARLLVFQISGQGKYEQILFQNLQVAAQMLINNTPLNGLLTKFVNKQTSKSLFEYLVQL